MDSISFKNYLINCLAQSTNISGLSDNEIILITSAGCITGKLVELRDGAYNANQHFLPELVQRMGIEYSESDINQEGDGITQSGLMLKDVVLRHNNIKYHLNHLFVFYDNILGITIGNI